MVKDGGTRTSSLNQSARPQQHLTRRVTSLLKNNQFRLTNGLHLGCSHHIGNITIHRVIKTARMQPCLLQLISFAASHYGNRNPCPRNWVPICMVQEFRGNEIYGYMYDVYNHGYISKDWKLCIFQLFIGNYSSFK